MSYCQEHQLDSCPHCHRRITSATDSVLYGLVGVRTDHYEALKKEIESLKSERDAILVASKGLEEALIHYSEQPDFSNRWNCDLPNRADIALTQFKDVMEKIKGGG